MIGHGRRSAFLNGRPISPLPQAAYPLRLIINRSIRNLVCRVEPTMDISAGNVVVHYRWQAVPRLRDECYRRALFGCPVRGAGDLPAPRPSGSYAPSEAA